MRNKRLGIALGGGGILGVAPPIGVLEVLEENGIIPDVVTGTECPEALSELYTQPG